MKTKAILVIDYMPSVCTECPFYEWVDVDNLESEEIRCGIRCGLGTFNFKDEKPSWCPLRPMPKYKQMIDGEEIDYEYGYIDGWNACLEALENSQNGEDSNE